MKKEQWDEVFEALLTGIRKAGDGVSGVSRKTARKARNDKRDIEDKDRDLADGQDAPDRPRDHDAPDGDADVDPAVQYLDVGTYEELRRLAQRGDGLEHDHVPSAAAILLAEEIRNGEPLSRKQIRDLYNNAAAIELPASVHRRTRTYGGRNTPAQIAADAADLAAAANRDYVDRIALMLEDGVPKDKISDAIRRLYEMNQERGIG